MSTHSIALAIAAGVVTLLAAGEPASAGKSQFERTKPHVNVGTANPRGSSASAGGQTAVIGGIGGLKQAGPAADKRSLMILITPKITTPPAN